MIATSGYIRHHGSYDTGVDGGLFHFLLICQAHPQHVFLNLLHRSALIQMPLSLADLIDSAAGTQQRSVLIV